MNCKVLVLLLDYSGERRLVVLDTSDIFFSRISTQKRHAQKNGTHIQMVKHLFVGCSFGFLRSVMPPRTLSKCRFTDASMSSVKYKHVYYLQKIWDQSVVYVRTIVTWCLNDITTITLSTVSGGLGVAIAREARLALVQDPGALVALGVVLGRARADTNCGAVGGARAGLLAGGDGASGRGAGSVSGGCRGLGGRGLGGRGLGGRGRRSDRSAPD